VANNAVRQLNHIATLPEVTLGIIELVENPRSSASALNALIGRDPALSARVLRVVNSAFYGLPQQLGSINRAISLLGLNAVKNIAIAASLAKLFRGGALCDRFDAKDLWTHSLAVGTAARLLAGENRKVAGDEAFLSGLMHDIGIVVELQCDRAKLVKVFGDMQFDGDGNPLIDFRMVERAVYGADHCHFGIALCEQWKFSKPLLAACGFHHDPASAPAENRNMAWLIMLADELAASGGGFNADIMSHQPSQEALAALGLNNAAIERVQAALPRALSEASATMNG
jgi:HD-like signal output (HDOD) protein